MAALVCGQLGDRTEAEHLLALMAPFSGQIVASGVVAVGAVDLYLGVLTATLGRFGEADAHFASAETMHLRIGAPTWLARPRLEWARMLLTRRQPGDPDRARHLLGQALATARDLGLANVERRAVALLQGCP
jgi:hypothetical protein